MNSSNLIVISNRLPFTLKRGSDGSLRRVPAAGGLVTAVAPVVIQTKGKKETKSKELKSNKYYFKEHG